MTLPKIPTNPKTAATLLRVGLAVVFLYADIASLKNPIAWEPFLPTILTAHFSADILLKLFSIFQFVLATWLISGWRAQYAAALSALTLVGVVVANVNAFDITFRDVALVFMALALCFLER